MSMQHMHVLIVTGVSALIVAALVGALKGEAVEARQRCFHYCTYLYFPYWYCSKSLHIGKKACCSGPGRLCVGKAARQAFPTRAGFSGAAAAPDFLCTTPTCQQQLRVLRVLSRMEPPYQHSTLSQPSCWLLFWAASTHRPTLTSTCSEWLLPQQLRSGPMCPGLQQLGTYRHADFSLHMSKAHSGFTLCGTSLLGKKPAASAHHC